MVVARKKYDYAQPQEQQQQQQFKKPKPKRSYRFEKIVVSIGIIAALSLSLMLLTRFAVITETRYRVNHLNTQLEQLHTQKEKLRVEAEKVSKSRWIESEAIDRLDMQYPSPEQILYIHVHPAEVAELSSQLSSKIEENPTYHVASNNNLNKVFDIIVGLFKI
ncbi:hypothetical protein SAMN05660297_00068 [Natronincola peptidivorans]|uniref:Cell division protein FtsL n=1 Tax=Natronincola peptidivorans TaxID=426128 RepID=A0A1H9Y710_9FIRM|nr:cell division protein FtsL [Natronincola peptidivorans]SES64521.1 hypothetical protein SAMN05660297_00068 [Natronincola peptidivorans]